MSRVEADGYFQYRPLISEYTNLIGVVYTMHTMMPSLSDTPITLVFFFVLDAPENNQCWSVLHNFIITCNRKNNYNTSSNLVECFGNLKLSSAVMAMEQTLSNEPSTGSTIYEAHPLVHQHCVVPCA